MRFYVPTAGRADKPLTTLHYLPPEKVTLVCPVGQATAYAEFHPSVEIVECPVERHIGRTRQWIWEHAQADHWQCDDDLKFRTLGEASVLDCISQIETLLQGDQPLGMVGLGQQFLGSIHLRSGTVHRGKPAFRTMGLRYTAMQGLDLSSLPVYEDLAMNVHAFRNGGVAVHYGAVTQDWSSGKADVGGCSQYRTPEVIEAAAQEMVRMFPDVCTVAPTKNTTHGMKLGYGVRVAWRKLR